MTKLRVLLAEDHVIVREGLRALLDAQTDVEVVGEATDGREALAASKALGPDVVVMDISMPGLNGARATEAIRPPALPTFCLPGSARESRRMAHSDSWDRSPDPGRFRSQGPRRFTGFHTGAP